MTTRITALALALTLLALPARAGIGRWTPFGPTAELILEVVVGPGDPSILYATTPAGLFRSLDGGESWLWWGLGIGLDQGIDGVVADAQDPRTMYAVSQDAKVFRSLDGGRSWVEAISFTVGQLSSLVDLAAAGGTVYAATYFGFYASSDRGKTWTRRFEQPLFELALDPSDPLTLYSIAYSGGVLKSTDGGHTWSEILAGPRVLELVVSPSHPSTVYAATEDTLYASHDGGATWSAGAALPGQFVRLAVDPALPTTVYAAHDQGASYSTDGGATWRTTLSEDAISVAVDPGHPGTVWVGTYFGLFVSRDSGRSWHSPLQRGLGFPHAAFLEQDPHRPMDFYLCHVPRQEQSCFRSRDGGLTWSSWLDGLPFHLADLAFDPRRPGVIYAAGPDGIFRVEGDGSWEKLPLVRSFSIVAEGGILVATGMYGASRSVDGGATWREVLPFQFDRSNHTSERIVHRFLQEPSDPGTLYALAHEAQRGSSWEAVYRSVDSGAHWKRLLPASRVLAIDPSQPSTLYAVKGRRLLRSRDRGESWRPIGTIPSAAVQDLIVHPSRSSILLAATSDAGVLISRDGGRAWSPLNAGLARPGLLEIGRLVADLAVPGRFFALPWGGGVFEITLP
jgi:photosystem II stability/assembly factor-like uncharacterized protein